MAYKIAVYAICKNEDNWYQFDDMEIKTASRIYDSDSVKKAINVDEKVMRKQKPKGIENWRVKYYMMYYAKKYLRILE